MYLPLKNSWSVMTANSFGLRNTLRTTAKTRKMSPGSLLEGLRTCGRLPRTLAILDAADSYHCESSAHEAAKATQSRSESVFYVEMPGVGTNHGTKRNGELTYRFPRETLSPETKPLWSRSCVEQEWSEKSSSNRGRVPESALSDAKLWKGAFP